jgi:hypothetical protein
VQRKTSDEQIFSYGTRPPLDQQTDHVLSRFAGLMGEVERSLFAEFAKGTPIQSLKSPFLKRFSITARQFNAIRVGVEGKVSSIKELQKVHLKTIDLRISSL